MADNIGVLDFISQGLQEKTFLASELSKACLEKERYSIISICQPTDRMSVCLFVFYISSTVWSFRDVHYSM